MWNRNKQQAEPAPIAPAEPFKAGRYDVQFIHPSLTLALSCIHSATFMGKLSTPGRHGVFGNDGTLVAWVTVS